VGSVCDAVLYAQHGSSAFVEHLQATGIQGAGLVLIESPIGGGDISLAFTSNGHNPGAAGFDLINTAVSSTITGLSIVGAPDDGIRLENSSALLADVSVVQTKDPNRKDLFVTAIDSDAPLRVSIVRAQLGGGAGPGLELGGAGR